MSEMKRRPRRAQVQQENCVACGCCVKVCPLGVIHVDRGLFASVDESRCIGCGKCARECPASVITIVEVTSV